MKEINKRLVEKYGKDLAGHPRFRLVFSDTQTEVRIGDFDVWAGDVWLRTEHGARVVPKYGHLIGRWILEILYLGHYPPEVVSTDPYECLWAFQQNQLPTEKAVDLILYSWHNRDEILREEKRTKKSEEELFNKEVADNLIKIQNNSPLLPSLMHLGSAAFFDSTKRGGVDVGSDDSKSDASPDK